MAPRHQRLIIVAFAVAAGGFAVLMASMGLRDSAAFFQTPSQVLADPPEAGQALSLGGLVALGSVRTDDGTLAFRLVDDSAGMDVRYAGPIPNLFREGQCVIAQGAYAPGVPFRARRVLAKHDESYTPREIANAPALARSCGDVDADAMTALDPTSGYDDGYAGAVGG